MSQTRKRRSKIEMGHDSFLDIVANLVGILIILVVVLGAQSTQVVEQQEAELDSPITVIDPEKTYASSNQLETLATQTMRANAAQVDSDRLEQLVRRYDNELEVRQQQRGKLIDLLAVAQDAWESKQAELDQKKLADAKLQTEFDLASDQLKKLQGETQRIEDAPEPVVLMEHLPTPMAKTVFGDEIHLRLKDNLLSVVPLERLLKEIETNLRQSLSGSSEGQRDGAVGPIRGYIARYLLERSRGLVNRGGSSQLATRVQLVGMTMEPLGEPHGLPVEQVIRTNGELDVELAGRDPGTTTVTVWVYPDSFGSFRGLQEHLYAKGFATAARPLPQGRKITASANGSRSTAQ